MNETLPIAQLDAAHVPPPFPSKHLTAVTGAAEQTRALDRAYQAEALDIQTFGTQPETTSEGVTSAEIDEPTFGENQEAYNEQLIQNDQMQGEARQAKLDAMQSFPEEPITGDPEAMKRNFNTTLTEESIAKSQMDNIGNVGELEEGEGILNTDFIEAVEAGDKRKAVEEELQAYVNGEEGGVLTNAFKVIDFVFAPAMAPLAAIEGALAHTPNEGESFIGTLVAAGDAFNERAFRWIDPEGGMMPGYSEAIVERF